MIKHNHLVHNFINNIPFLIFDNLVKLKILTNKIKPKNILKKFICDEIWDEF